MAPTQRGEEEPSRPRCVGGLISDSLNQQRPSLGRGVLLQWRPDPGVMPGDGFVAGRIWTASSWDCNVVCTQPRREKPAEESALAVGACQPASGLDGDARAWMVSPATWALGFWPQQLESHRLLLHIAIIRRASKLKFLDTRWWAAAALAQRDVGQCLLPPAKLR